MSVPTEPHIYIPFIVTYHHTITITITILCSPAEIFNNLASSSPVRNLVAALNALRRHLIVFVTKLIIFLD